MALSEMEWCVKSNIYLQVMALRRWSHVHPILIAIQISYNLHWVPGFFGTQPPNNSKKIFKNQKKNTKPSTFGNLPYPDSPPNTTRLLYCPKDFT